MEIDVFTKIKSHKGFTGCLHLIEASAGVYSRYGNKENKKISGPTMENNVTFCNGRTPCQDDTLPCAEGETCQEIVNDSFCQANYLQDSEAPMEVLFNGFR